MSVHKIIIVGDNGVGKKSFKNRIMKLDSDSDNTNPIDTQTAMLEDQCLMTSNRFVSWSHNGQTFKIEFKIVGPDEIPGVRDSYYRSASGFICMFALDNESSFQKIQKMREQILNVRAQTKSILCGNKCDLPKKQRKVKKRDAKNLAKKWKAEYFETSMLNNRNLEECLNILLQAIVEKKHTRMVRARPSLRNTLDRFKYYNCFG